LRFGEWLRKQREANGLSMDAVASMTGLDKQYIQQVETDQIVHPGADKLMRLAEVYYVDLREMYRRAYGMRLNGEGGCPREGETFGEWLRRKREAAGLGVRQLGQYADVSPSYISRLQKGQSEMPSPLVLQKIAKVLNVTEEEIMVAAGYLPLEAEIEEKDLLAQKVRVLVRRLPEERQRWYMKALEMEVGTNEKSPSKRASKKKNDGLVGPTGFEPFFLPQVA